MSFLEELAQWPPEKATNLIESARPADVERALRREELRPEDLAALLSCHAEPRLEGIAREAQRLTRWHFGRTVGMYVPIYLSNVCAADCLYCGYAANAGTDLKRRTLSMDEVRAECEALAGHGFQNVLLLTGEAPAVVTVDYIAEAVAVARDYFAAVSVEIYALDQEDYALLFSRGLEGVTLYIETYHRPTYEHVHRAGRKKDFVYRLDAIERAGRAGVRRLSIGPLLGLYDWRIDGFWMGLHARYLQRACWRSAVGMSFPRLRHTPPRFGVPYPVSDKELVQLMLAMRLFVPEAGFNLSTREPADLRDRLIPLGVTMMSAGSSTRPGGYSVCGPETLEQFEIEDRRPPAEVAEAIRAAGYEPVWKDFDRAFDDAHAGPRQR